MSNELKVKADHAKALIEGRRAQLLEVLPKHIQPDRMLRVFQNAVTRNPKLLMCNDLSILTSLATCGAFGLEPNTPLGQCHIIPYGNQATFQMGYQGLIELARRAGTTITCGTVHENDTVIAREGLHQDFDITYDIKQGRGEVIGVYAIAETKEGNKLWRYMSIPECMEHGKRYSKAFNKPDSPWQTARIPMCLKTVIVQVCKYAPKSILAEWVEVETRVGMKLETLTPSSALQDDDSPIFDVDATEPEPAKRTLDDIAQENTQDAHQAAQADAGKPTRSELNKMLLAARKAAKMSHEDLEALARAEYGHAIGDLNDEAIVDLIDLCSTK